MIGGRFGELLARLRGGVASGDRDRLAAILQLNRALAAAEDRRSMLVALLDEAVTLFGAERAFVVESEGGDAADFGVAAARNLDREDVRRPESKLSRTVLSKVLNDGEPVFADDAAVDGGELSAARSVAELRLRSVLCVPLRVGARRIGALYVDHRFASGAFVEADLPWLEAFADQAAIAVHLHRLLDGAQQRRRDIESENQLLAAAAVAQTGELAALQPLRRDDLDGEFPEILGESPALLRHLRLLDRVCNAGDFPVLIVGESGCGKELAARAVHQGSPRSGGPWVAVNVAAIRAELLESELFGHRRGAFTGADRDRVGLIREADGGVLFLDEVTEMPLELQAKLLRFLEERSVRPLGGDHEVPVDVRIVAATNRDPQRAVAEGTFREDLFYRLAVVTVPLPPLRERLEDLEVLVEHFFTEAAAARGGEAAPRRAAPELLAALRRRRWPGNLRELRNTILRLDALVGGDVVGPELLEPEAAPTDALESLDLATLERSAIHAALRRAEGNKAEAARLLGISRRSLYDRLRRVGLD